MSNIARPFIPWVGGKEKLVPYVRQVFPDNVSQYLEPFGGGGAVLLSLPPNPKRLDIYNDLDSELVNMTSQFTLFAPDQELKQELRLVHIPDQEIRRKNNERI